MNNSGHTFESVWVALQESNRILTEKFAESDRLRQENERFLTEKFAEVAASQAATDLQMAQTDQKIAAVATQLKTLGTQMGGWEKSHGQFAEEYFINSLNNSDKKFFGEQFHSLYANIKFSHSLTKKEGEFDVVLLNGTAAAIIEVKFKARKNDFQQLLKQVASFRDEFPQYKSHRIYLGMAALTYEDDVEKELKAEGIAVFKQDGETMVMTDENLKTF
jgi:Holliday junction resolvase-like predicted endonuclease